MESIYSIDVMENHKMFCRDFYYNVLEKYKNKIEDKEVYEQTIFLLQHPEIGIDFVDILDNNVLQKEYKKRLVSKLIIEDNMERSTATSIARKYLISLKKFIRYTKTLI